LDGEDQQRVIAPPGPGGAVRRGQQRVDLRLGEVADQAAVAAFSRDGQYPLDEGGVVGVAQGGEAEEGAQGGQPGVAGGYRAAAVVFQMIEERPDQRRVQILMS
jgi:hypothetical protein